MADDLMTLFCLVDGQSTLNAFSVEIDPTKTVDGLKKLITTEETNDLSDVDADKLTLSSVSISITELTHIASSGKKRPGPATRLSKVFTEELPEET